MNSPADDSRPPPAAHFQCWEFDENYTRPLGRFLDPDVVPIKPLLNPTTHQHEDTVKCRIEI
ncbi:hypothetical protein [Polaromonas sp.]|uniref:hypothetical protein n=1 Tax=Polaromonas sp. TaxID=1869339 RepID=UPI0013BA54E5|nr:hypothetical protein [Polaromonas sp.]NDP62776.1 hypothetical protein [Polaromonas sp.]